jgi:hypothetical protein
MGEQLFSFGAIAPKRIEASLRKQPNGGNGKGGAVGFRKPQMRAGQNQRAAR